MAKKVIGVVTSDVQDKTIVVTVTSRRTHPLYRKQYTESRKFTAHDETNQAQKGDRVEIVECRPISKRKTWKLDHIVETGHAKIELEENEIVAELEHKNDELKEDKV
ncbi:30S ribosomal protein S17 [Candidatus Saccharibacteria bacterium]|nr:30S ribosomal protein S17 [Candidatus Saccharibacteria bacterium]NCU40968.1 30S ribosomal protein S17 [Candidatus Saccharibacteria bacterium]